MQQTWLPLSFGPERYYGNDVLLPSPRPRAAVRRLKKQSSQNRLDYDFPARPHPADFDARDAA